MSSDLSAAIGLLGGTAYGRLSVSMRAMPFVIVARHVVDGDGGVLVLLHGGHGYHRACDGNVVAYGADNAGPDADDVWSAQIVGIAHVAEPTDGQRSLFGPLPRTADGAPFTPVYLRVHPQFTTVHSLGGVSGPSGRSSK